MATMDEEDERRAALPGDMSSMTCLFCDASHVPLLLQIHKPLQHLRPVHEHHTVAEVTIGFKTLKYRQC